jgi:peptidoglycan/LPS O-acetylase OafA/YrhL
MQTLTRSLFSPPRPERSGHYFSVDFGRGLAAVVVLIWHYAHFFFTAGATAPSIARSAQPFYTLLRPFYDHGYYAVEYFWLISGFVFAAVYAGRATDTRSFVVNRVARLYPLHVLTLVVVALLQLLSVAVCGHEQIYVNNDLWHFILNLLFASHWGLEKGYSFNGPTWSVSIEILIYAVFWLTLPVIYRRGIVGPVLLAGICWCLHYHTRLLRVDEDSLRCGFYFFAGAAVWILTSPPERRAGSLLGIAAILITMGAATFRWRPHSTDSIGMPLFLLGLLMIFCAIEAGPWRGIFRSTRWFGDCTYGTYLWHVPIQILILTILDRFVGSREPALHGWFFLSFVLLTMLVARLSFIGIEKPARAWIQRRFGDEGPLPAPAVNARADASSRS